MRECLYPADKPEYTTGRVGCYGTWAVTRRREAWVRLRTPLGGEAAPARLSAARWRLMARPPHGAAASWRGRLMARMRPRVHEAAAVTGSPGISHDVIAADVIARHAVLCRSD